MTLMRSRFLITALTLTLAATVAYAGGWSIITVKDWPEYAVAGRPVSVTFSVRQHGNHLVEGLSPGLAATTPDGRRVKAVAVATRNKGEYTASVAFPEAGDWTVRLDGGFNEYDAAREYNAVSLPPLKVIRTGGAPPPALSAAGSGERLFVSKGCIGCHGADRGNELSGKQFAADYLKAFLANPAIRTADMPNLGLTEAEITALTAFLNTPKRP